MSQIAKLLLHDLGSFEAQNVQFRTAWYLITEKSIQGYTPYEDVHLANQGQWPNPHRLRMCIPPRIVGKQVHPDSSLMRSSKRKRFCMSTRFVWPGFCDVSTINDPLTDGLQLLPNNLSSTLPAWSVSDLINTPVVLVVTSPVNPYLPLALETLVRQPFLQPHNVLLAHYKQDSAAVESLADLFAMRSAVLHSDPAKVAKSLRITIQLLFAGATHLIWLSSQFLLSPDLFLYFAQLLPLLRDPKSELSAISAWNQNSRYLVSSDERVAYRVSSSLVPIQNSFLINVNLMDKCNVLNDYLKILILLSGGAAANLSKDSCPEFHYLMPDLSRILFFDQQKVCFEKLQILFCNIF